MHALGKRSETSTQLDNGNVWAIYSSGSIIVCEMRETSSIPRLDFVD